MAFIRDLILDDIFQLDFCTYKIVYDENFHIKLFKLPHTLFNLFMVGIDYIAIPYYTYLGITTLFTVFNVWTLIVCIIGGIITILNIGQNIYKYLMPPYVRKEYINFLHFAIAENPLGQIIAATLQLRIKCKRLI